MTQVVNVLAEAARRYKFVSVWSAQGNFMWYHMNDSIHWSIQKLKYHDEETLRPTCHLTYSKAFQKTPAYEGFESTDDKHTAKHSVAFYTVTAQLILHGLCDVLPEGKMHGCDNVEKGPQAEFREWEGVYNGDGYWENSEEEQATIYHRHFDPLWALYDEVVESTCGKASGHHHGRADALSIRRVLGDSSHSRQLQT